jgi:protein-tyrosine phosphatase
MSDERFSVLFVCTANICRSPMAERLAAHVLLESLGAGAARFTMASAGTKALEGEDMHPYTAQVLQAAGAPAGGFRARQVLPQQVAGADLILTATRTHRSAVVSLDPSALGRCFTIPQFARLTEAVTRSTTLPEGDPVQRGRALVRETARARALLQPVPAEEDEIPDPIGRSLEAFDACGALLRQTLRPPLELITGR